MTKFEVALYWQVQKWVKRIIQEIPSSGLTCGLDIDIVDSCRRKSRDSIEGRRRPTGPSVHFILTGKFDELDFEMIFEHYTYWIILVIVMDKVNRTYVMFQSQNLNENQMAKINQQ